MFAGVMTASNNVSFRLDVCQCDDIEIPLSSPNVCRSDHSDIGRREDVDYSAKPKGTGTDDHSHQNTEVFDACRDDQEFLVDSGQNGETSTSSNVRTNEPDVLHSDDLGRVGIGCHREAHNLCNTD